MVPKYGAAGAAFATGLSLCLGGLVAFVGAVYFSGSVLLQWKYIAGLLPGIALYSAAAALHGLVKPGLVLDIAAFAAASALFAWDARRRWALFNAAHA
jgi:hypothetical protein